MTYLGPALDPPLDGSGQKTTTLVRDHEYFIPTKFHQNPSSGSGEEVENVKSLRRTTDGRCAMTIAHSSLRLRLSKKGNYGIEIKMLAKLIIILPANEFWGVYRSHPVCLFVCSSVCQSRVNLTLAITFELKETRLSYYTRVFFVTRPFSPYQKL